MRTKCVRPILFGVLAAALAFPQGDVLLRAQQPPQKPPQEQKKDKPAGEFQLSVEVPLVNVDVVVTDNDGGFLSGLRKENFRVLEDGVPQSITNFSPTDAPITIVLLVEFSKIGRGVFALYSTYMAEDFLRQLKPDDWVALKSFDLRTHIEADFTRNKEEVRHTLRSMVFPGFTEAVLYDAVY